MHAQKTLSRSIDAHLRAITDINWHPRNHNLMATVSMDAGIRGWDLRVQGSTPIIRLSAWGAAGTQVKWNRKAEHILATAHGTRVLVWDDRYGSVPVATIQAHDSKIYGIDWDRRLRHRLVTCSLDKTIKFWDIPSVVSEDDRSTLASEDFSAGEPFTNATIQTGYPVWRARNLPWGHGVLALPQRGETALEMFGTDGSNVPIERWEGSSGVVKEFVWRRRGGADPDFEDRNFQLITWSLDRKLRIWPMPKDLLERAGYKPGAPIDVDVTRRGAIDRTFSVPLDPLGQALKPLGPEKPTIPSGIARQRMLQRPALTSMTRGGKSTRKIGQIEWLSRIVKTGPGAAAVASDSSAGPSRAPSVAGRDSTNGSSSRSRSKGPHGGRTESLRHMSQTRGLSLTRASSVNTGVGTESVSDLIPLKDEVLSVHKMFPKSKVNFEKFDLSQRKLTMSLNGPWANGDRYAFIRVHWSFPPNYPYGPEIPTFELERNATVSPITRHRMISTIKEMRAANRQCLISVTEFLLGYHERTSRRVVDEDSDSDTGVDEAANVPMLIRTTGAAFGPNGQLVCFFPKQTVLPRARSGHSRSPSREDPMSTPLAKALSALSRLENPHNKPTMVRYKRHVRTMQAQLQPMQSRSTLSLYNVSHLVPEPDPELARLYTASIDGNLVHALEVKKLEHAEVWAALRALLTDPPPPYSDHAPLSRTAATHAERFRWEREMERKRCVVDGIFDRLMERMDMQMLALVSCCLLEYEQSAPPPPAIEEVAQPEPSYFGMRKVSRASAGSGGTSGTAVTPFGPGRRSSSLTPSTPVSATGPGSLRTSGWSQILMNPSSISLRGMALTPRDRTSFDQERTPGSYEERSPVAIPGTPSRHDHPFTRHESHSSITGLPGLPSPRRRATRPFARSGSMALASPPLPPVPPTPTGRSVDERAATASASSVPESSNLATSAPRTGTKVSFGSASPLRRVFSKPNLAQTPGKLERRRMTCGVHLEFSSDAPPPSLLRSELLPLAELWKLAYADWLLRAGLVGKRAALLQYEFASSPPPKVYREGLVYATRCRACDSAFVPQGEEKCTSCSVPRQAPLCSVCNTTVKGLSASCTLCQHTSHWRCLRATLELLKHCPACSCQCADGGLSANFSQTRPEGPTRQVLVEDPRTQASKRFERSSRFVDLTGGDSRPASRSRERKRDAGSFGSVGSGYSAAGGYAQGGFSSFGGELGLKLTPSHTDEEEYHSQSIAALQSVEQRDAEREREGRDREREREREMSPPPREAAREGMLARARARALGPEGILPW